MTKPIGYFCSGAMPGDTGLIAEMQDAWGSTFAALSNTQRLWIIHQTALHLFMADPTHCDDREHDDEVEDVTERLAEISYSECLGLLEALVSQVKTSRH
ncbi:MAG: hypothetical protein KME22_08965 [Hassallia sp. WJT32-NPBG1]|jgi:hypothetical protein|nr:hypothetical protein [Hassallia sp. WJT32-NPBG1]